MRKIRELLRLKYDLGRSHRDIARSLGIANSTVSDYVRRASATAWMEYLSQFEDHGYDRLPRPMQRRISETQLSCHVIPRSTLSLGCLVPR